MAKRKNKIRVGRTIVTLMAIIFILAFGVYYFVFKESSQPKDESEVKVEEPTPEVIVPPSTTKIDFSNELSLSGLDENVQTDIVDFFNSYYKSMALLETTDVTKYFYDENSASALVYQTAIDLLVELRKMKHVDLTLYDGFYNLEIDSIKESGNTVTVNIKEDSFINFTFMKELTTEVLNVNNEFVFEKINGEYELIKYFKGQDFYVLVTDKYNGSDIVELNEVKDNYISQTESLVLKWNDDYNFVLENGITSTKECSYEYDRESAKEYANKYVGIRNEQWATFDANCQNYASQMLMAGGIPMDYYGDANKQLQLKFYDSSYNLNEEPKGYNYTWTYVPYFYTYAKNNTGTGLCATVDENIYFAEAGDVMQLGTKWYDRHTVVVVDNYKVDGVLQDIILNSNSVDLKNFPLSAYTYPYQRLIKVHGYN